MRLKLAKICVTFLVSMVAMPIAAQAWERGKVERFATLPAGEAHPEGICVGPDGNVYVVTVAANKPDTAGGTLLVFDGAGKHLRTVNIPGSSPWLLDLNFHPQTGQLLIIDYKTPAGPAGRSGHRRIVGIHDGQRASTPASTA
jgi:sugar lactone lactonase YvrE